MKKFAFLFTLWLSSFVSIFVFAFIFSVTYKHEAKVLGASISLDETETEVFASLPSSKPEIGNQIEFRDARGEIIKNYLIKYKANEELIQDVDFLIKKSDERGVDPRFIVAISRKESTFCKNIAKLSDGSSSNNCGGLGIFGHTITSFPTIKDWIEAEIDFIANAYISKGISDTCEIEKTHTPPAKGLWCQAINQYVSEMQ